MADVDQDRLSGCQEILLGTDPTHADTDNDGLSDGDEVLGTLAGLNLPALGVNPLRKNLLVEIDWMVGPECYAEGFSRKPTTENVAMVTEMFANAPVWNPDGSSGIDAIIDYGQGGFFTGGNEIDDGDALLDGDILHPDAEFHEKRSEHSDHRRLGHFHYGIMAWRHQDANNYSSGVAEVGGDDFIVSMHCAGNDHLGAVAYSNTIMHELGHNFGLLHGGGNYCNYRPNYDSVMNYRYAMFGNDFDCDANSDYIPGTFSDGSRSPLDEFAIDEPQGVCGDLPLDWNFDGQISSGLLLDLNKDDGLQDQTCGGTHTVLHDHNDWAAVSLASIANGGENQGPPNHEISNCLPVPTELQP